MIVVKYFHEEPAGLEPLAEDTDPEARLASEPTTLEAFLARPPYYRGYLAATELPSLKTGATTPGAPRAWVEPLIDTVGKGDWCVAGDDGSWLAVDPVEALSRGEPGHLLVIAGGAPPFASPDAGSGDVRRSLSGIRSLLDAGATVLRAEPAPDGVDWAIFCPHPLADRLRRTFAEHPADGTRRFVIPLREARGEHRFYFERYDLDLYSRHEVG